MMTISKVTIFVSITFAFVTGDTRTIRKDTKKWREKSGKTEPTGDYKNAKKKLMAPVVECEKSKE